MQPVFKKCWYHDRLIFKIIDKLSFWFGTIILTLNKSNYDFYRRSYKKMQTLLAEIMSIVNLLFEIGRQILSFLNEKKMSIDIIRTLFNIEKKSRKYKLIF